MRVALALLSFSGFAESALRGVAAYARPLRPWTFDHGSQGLEGVNQLLARKPDGILVSTSDPLVCARIDAAGIPAVNLHYYRGWAASCRVSNDDYAVGALAAEHFLSRAHKQFAYYAETGEAIDQRLEGFRQKLAQAGHICSSFRGGLPDPLTDAHAAYEQSFVRWLTALPRPVAVFCAHDHAAWALAERCSRLNIAIPTEVSILGVDNDTVICGLADPPLSSIQTSAERQGYEAAHLLDQLMAGERPAKQELEVPPIRVVTRRSSDSLAVPEELVAGVLAHMRKHLTDTEGIELMCARFNCSRRTLERRFDVTLGISPAQAWARFRIDEAQKLLADTDLPLRVVADLSGFSDSRIMTTAFIRLTGLTPGQFRRNARPESASSEPPAEASAQDLLADDLD